MENKRYTIGLNRNIDYIVFDYNNLQEVFDYSKENAGIYRIDPALKTIFWFKNSYESQMYTERVDKINMSLRELNEASRHGEAARKKRYYMKHLWVFANKFNQEEWDNAISQVPKPFKNTAGMGFYDIEDAVAWIKEQGISKASDKIIMNSIMKNLRGDSGKSYSLVWSYIK